MDVIELYLAYFISQERQCGSVPNVITVPSWDTQSRSMWKPTSAASVINAPFATKLATQEMLWECIPSGNTAIN